MAKVRQVRVGEVLRQCRANIARVYRIPEARVRRQSVATVRDFQESDLGSPRLIRIIQLGEQENTKKGRNPPVAIVTSGQVSPRSSGVSGGRSPQVTSGSRSPQVTRGGQSLQVPSARLATSISPQACCSSQPDGRDSPKPGSSRSSQKVTDHGLGPGLHRFSEKEAKSIVTISRLL